MDHIIRFPYLLQHALLIRGACPEVAAAAAASIMEILGLDLESQPTGGIPPAVFLAITKAILIEGPENHRAAGMLVAITIRQLQDRPGLAAQEMQQLLADFRG